MEELNANREVVSLLIEDQVFKINKETLIKYSDYFRAMFSGNYVETKINEIKIDIVEPDSMNLLIQYMNTGSFDLSKLNHRDINNLIATANFFQVNALLKEIETNLEAYLSPSNCFETMTLAENAPFPKLEQYAVSYALYSFDRMKTTYIPTIDKLFWYLSHPYLYAKSELDVFKYGFKWISNASTEADALMIILSSLDVRKLNQNFIIEIKEIIKDYKDCLAVRIIDYILKTINILKTSKDNNQSSEDSIYNELMLRFTSKSLHIEDEIEKEVYNLVKESKQRKLQPVVALPLDDRKRKYHYVPPNLYTWNFKSGLKKWLKVVDENCEGWSVTTWGPWRLVVVGGRQNGKFITDIRIYDTLKKQWTQHSVKLPCRKSGAITVNEDSLYIIGGVDQSGWVNSALVYDLRKHTLKKIANLPNDIYFQPGICNHKGKIYTSGQFRLFRYDELNDCWESLATKQKTDALISLEDNIYCKQSPYGFTFNPDSENKLRILLDLRSHSAIVNFGTKLLSFSSSKCEDDPSKALNTVEELIDTNNHGIWKVIWSEKGDVGVTDHSSSVALIVVTELAPLYNLSSYHEKLLNRFVK